MAKTLVYVQNFIWGVSDEVPEIIMLELFAEHYSIGSICNTNTTLSMSI